MRSSGLSGWAWVKTDLRRRRLWAVSLCRVVVALTLVVSGFLKAVDPVGMCAKVDAYLTAWGLGLGVDSLLLRSGVLVLAVLEFMMGVQLLLGMRRRLTITLLVAFQTVMTALTTYLFFTDTVEDCGCFGTALTLTDGQTLLKNVVLLAMIVFISRHGRYVIRLVSERRQWLASLTSLCYVVALTLMAYHTLPAIDFGPYAVGTDLRQAYTAPDADTPALLTTLCLEDENGNDLTDSLLSSKGKTCLLTLPRPQKADDGSVDRINDIADIAADSAFGFYAVVPQQTVAAEVSDWKDRSGGNYPTLKADPAQIEAMVRSNPGLVLIEDGKVCGKWSFNNLPATGGEHFGASQNTAAGRPHEALPKLVMWYIIPLLVVLLLDRLLIGKKFYQHYILRQHLKTTTMRKKIVAGNWKMNKTLQEGVALAEELNNVLAADKPNCDVVICTPFIHLAPVAGIINAEVIGLGAENCADKVSGAYTGEVSAAMVKSTGAQYVILGHSERRAYYGETAEILKEKVNLALENGLKVIFCIGEVLEERESGKQNDVVKAQLEGSLFDLSAEQMSNIILAYEPVWAIGTGKTATAEQAEEMHAFIRGVMADKFGAEVAENLSILYGGSCKPSNAKEIFAKPNVDGGLIGGAALKVADFKGIIDAWK